MSVKLQTDRFNDQLPPSISGDRQVISIGNALDINNQALLPLIDRIRVLCNIDNLDEPIVDLLAFQYQVLFYPATFTIVDDAARLLAKKAIIKQSFDYHFRAGTRDILSEILTLLYQDALVQEWFEYGGTAHHFRILTKNVITDNAVVLAMINVINVVKRASSWFEGFFVYVEADELIYATIAVYTEAWVTAPIAKASTQTVLGGRASVTAIANVLQASALVSAIRAMITIFANPRVVSTGAPLATLLPHSTVSATGSVRRGSIVSIHIGR